MMALIALFLLIYGLYMTATAKNGGAFVGLLMAMIGAGIIQCY